MQNNRSDNRYKPNPQENNEPSLEKLKDIFGEDIAKCTAHMSQPGIAEKLNPEVETGNIEYKRHLINMTSNKIEEKSAQMKWRVFEGNGKAIYYIGYDDDGQPYPLSMHEFLITLYYLKHISDLLQFELFITDMWQYDNKHNNISNEGTKFTGRLEVKKSMCGLVDCEIVGIKVIGRFHTGKSSLLSVLAFDELDDGEGSARMNLLRHQHEIESGKTSSITQISIGFDERGNKLNNDCLNMYLNNEVLLDVPLYKKVDFYDSGGYHKYSKTILNSLCRIKCASVMFVTSIDDLNYIEGIYQLLYYCSFLGHRSFIVINKIDKCSEAAIEKILGMIIDQIGKLETKLFHKIIQSLDELDKYINSKQMKKKCIPIFLTSSTYGTNIELLEKYILTIDNANRISNKKPRCKLFFKINSYIDGNIGLVVEGDIIIGSIYPNLKCKIGPFNNNEYIDIKIISVHRDFIPLDRLTSNSNGSAKIETADNSHIELKKGMVIVDQEADIQPVTHFSCKVILLDTSKRLKMNQEIHIHIDNTHQTCRIVSITEKKSKNINLFIHRPEIIFKGERFIFDHNGYNGGGVILKT